MMDEGYMKSSFWKLVYMSYIYLFSRYLLRKLQRLQLPTLVLMIERKLLKVQKDEAEQCNEDSFNLNMVIRWIVSSWRNKRIKKKRCLMSLRRQSLHLDGLSWKYCVKWTENIGAVQKTQTAYFLHRFLCLLDTVWQSIDSARQTVHKRPRDTDKF